VVAKYHGVLFYVAAPFTSIDFRIPSGEHILIEERPEHEMSHVADHRIAAPGLLVLRCPFSTTSSSWLVKCQN